MLDGISIVMAYHNRVVQLTRTLNSIMDAKFDKNKYNTINYLTEPPKSVCGDGWYNHSMYRPKYYHFCSAMSTSNLFKLNGFDEDYKNSIGWDDNEFIYRINKLGLSMKIIDNPFVLHQWHDSIFHYNTTNTEEFIQKN